VLLNKEADRTLLTFTHRCEHIISAFLFFNIHIPYSFLYFCNSYS